MLDNCVAPKVSIIMGAYNAEKTLRDAIDSILNQEYTNWEFIICDDGSIDGTLRICNEYSLKHPGRFRVLVNEQNMKLAATLNRCLQVARGEYIARMDADDISAPNRLTKQVAVLEQHPDIDLVGTAMRRFDDAGLRGYVRPMDRPTSQSLRRSVPFCHATVLARQTVFDRIGGYSEAPRSERVEDLDLWFNFYKHGFCGINITEPLYLVREDAAAFRRRTVRARLNGFFTSISGFRRLGFPLHWYVYPVLDLSKALVPYRAQQLYRRWQEHRRALGPA